MSNKLLMIAVICCGGAAACLYIDRFGAPWSSVIRSGGVSISPNVFDAGHVGVNVVTPVVFRLVNHDSSPCRITGLQTSCSCAEPVLSKPILMPGETGEFSVQWHIGQAPGARAVKVSLSVQCGDRIKRHHLTLTAVVTPEIIAKPDHAVFSGAEAKKVVALEFPTTPKATVTSVSTTHPGLDVTYDEAKSEVCVRRREPLRSGRDAATVMIEARHEGRSFVYRLPVDIDPAAPDGEPPARGEDQQAGDQR
jgi:hypothetical protein